jgi:hypothetical protein
VPIISFLLFAYVTVVAYMALSVAWSESVSESW